MEEEVARKKRKIRELKKQILQQQQIVVLSPPSPAESCSTKKSTMTKKSTLTEKSFMYLFIWFKRNQKNKNILILDNVKIHNYWDNIFRKKLNMHDYLTHHSDHKPTKKLNIGNCRKIQRTKRNIDNKII